MVCSKEKTTAKRPLSYEFDNDSRLAEFIGADTQAAIERVLDDKTLFSMEELAESDGPSIPTQYRWMNAGILPFVWDGARRKITRATRLRLMLRGAGRLARNAATRPSEGQRKCP